ncbi:hypothetical protein H4Q26_001494 [Puccinia striiformis f. sp. tritici PST-130]|nr:hypothetical protein H4Q26_001494 [Puccinia striiformis f. sp. tritici PST-130]
MKPVDVYATPDAAMNNKMLPTSSPTPSRVSDIRYNRAGSVHQGNWVKNSTLRSDLSHRLEMGPTQFYAPVFELLWKRTWHTIRTCLVVQETFVIHAASYLSGPAAGRELFIQICPWSRSYSTKGIGVTKP